jgi:hypothetical protein
MLYMLPASRQALNLRPYYIYIYIIHYIKEQVMCFLALDKLSIYYIIYLLYIIYTYVMAYYVYASWISTSSQSTAILYIYIMHM